MLELCAAPQLENMRIYSSMKHFLLVGSVELGLCQAFLTLDIAPVDSILWGYMKDGD